MALVTIVYSWLILVAMGSIYPGFCKKQSKFGRRGVNNMAGRLCSCGSVVIYLLICVIVLHFSGKPRMAAERSAFSFWKLVKA